MSLRVLEIIFNVVSSKPRISLGRQLMLVSGRIVEFLFLADQEILPSFQKMSGNYNYNPSHLWTGKVSGTHHHQLLTKNILKKRKVEFPRDACTPTCDLVYFWDTVCLGDEERQGCSPHCEIQAGTKEMTEGILLSSWTQL